MSLLQEGARLFNLGRFDEAEQLVKPALAAAPDNPELCSLFGQIALAKGRIDEALDYFDQVLKRFPAQLELRAHRAMVLLKLGRKDESKEELETILSQDPNSYVALKHLGALYGEDGNNEQAEPFLRRALEIDSNEPECLYLMGKLLYETDRIVEARSLLKRAIKIRPRVAIPFSLMGATYRNECRFRVALSFYRHAFRLDPLDRSSNVNYGVGLLDTGQVHEAIAQFKHYLEIDPECTATRFNMSTALLQIGRLDEGWQAYEARRRMHKMRDSELPYADWQNQPLAGKTVLVLAEQGIGDELLAANMFDDLIKRAGHCMIECDSRLVTLYSRSFPTATIVPRLPTSIQIPKEPPVDYKSPGLSLARWLRNDLKQFPGKVGYLAPDPQRQEFWRWRLAQLGAGLKVGIAWRSMMTKGVRRDSYSSLDEWQEIFSIPGVQFVNLQYGECQADLDAAASKYNIHITNFTDINLKDGMDDVAALMSVLDVVIAPDNAVAVMAGALNIPVLQFVLSKYWSCHGKDYYPWHPSVELFFRAWDRDWSEPLQAVAIDLKRRSHQRSLEEVSAGLGEDRERTLLRERTGRGVLLLQSRQAEKAKAIFSEILAVRPNHVEANLLLGLAEKALQRPAEAEAAISRAIELEPLFAEAYNHRGALFLETGRPQDAIPDFRQALELHPGFPDALSNLGSAFAAGRQFAEAMECYRRAIAGFSGFMTARYNYALVLEDVGRNEEAITEYETVVEGDPRHADAWNNLGNLYGRLQRNEEAINAYRMALSAKPEMMIARTNLAKKILAAGGDIDEALEHLKAAAAAHPEDERIANNLGAAYAAKGDMDAAAEQFEKAVALKPDYADAYRNLGLALQHLGRLEEARDVLLKGIQLMTGAAENPSGNDAPIGKLLH